jgi:hypothetical protein
MNTYAKRKLKYSWNENFNLLHYVKWDRIEMPNMENFYYDVPNMAIDPNKDISKTRQVHVK